MKTYHPARLAYVAGRMKPLRNVVDRKFDPSGWTLTLECTHVVEIVSHFDCSKTTERSCRECGIARALLLPEFKDGQAVGE